MSAYTNPVISGFHPDPSVCRNGDDYYLVTSTFEYFPGVPVFHSRDLYNWHPIGHCLDRESQLDLHGCKSSGGIYAPTIRYHDGRFFMITTNRNVGNGDDGNFLVTTGAPSGRWSEPVWIDQEGIDPSLLFDDDGTVYFTNKIPWQTGSGIRQSIIDVESGQRKSEVVKIWEGTGGSHPEGPHLYKINGLYYLMVAEGGTGYGHMETIARSESPFGPFEDCPFNPILSHRSSNSSIQCTGHADLIEDHRGNWWVVFLGVRTGGHPMRHHLGRETFLAPVTWKDGWPVVNDGNLVELSMASELAPHPPAVTPARDHFDGDALRPVWNFRTNPVPEHWSLSKKLGSLTLNCVPATLNDVGSKAFIGRRQQHFGCTATALLDFEPSHPGDEAGLTAILDERHRCEILVSQNGGSRVVRTRTTIGPLSSEGESHECGAGPVELRILADSICYQLSFRGRSNDEFVVIGKVETRYLSTEVAGGFTGVYLGMYATSNGSPSSGSAHFDWFDYAPE